MKKMILRTTKRVGVHWLLLTLFFTMITASLYSQSIAVYQLPISNGSMVSLSGNGFSANENIVLQVLNTDNSPVAVINPWFVKTDANGNFQTSQTIYANSNESVSDLKIAAHARNSGAWVQVFLDGKTPAITGANPAGNSNHTKNIPAAPIPNGNLIDCTGAPDPGNTLASSNPICANVELTLSLQNSGGSGVTYQWQSNTGGGFTNIIGATDATYTTTQTVGTNYQCIVTCTGSGLFTLSSNLLVSMASSDGCPLTVVPGGTATQIAQALLGPDVTISNATINCTTNAYGIFSGGLTGLGLSSGIVLTSGSAVDLIGPNTSSAQTTDNMMPGDPELTALTTSETFDACYIAFDFVPTCDSISFDYVFGSEEYPEYVNSPFNDVFAFFISGPGIVGTQNMALVPGALIPIEINNVNDGYTFDCPAVLPGPCMNCQYYVNNCEGTTLQYDGHTTVLAASSVVTSGKSYHLKIAIADAGDPVLDSGVMLELNSLSCVSTAVIEQDAYRGCQDGRVRFCRTGSSAEPQTIHYTIGGTAVNGVDYLTIPDSIVIPAGQECATLDIVATLVITNEIKTVVLTTTDMIVLTVNISDGVAVNTTVTVDQQCGYSVLEASGADTYTWSPADGLNTTTGEEVIASPPVPTTYTVIGRITESGCEDTVTVNVIAGPPLYTYYLDADADGYGNAAISLLTCLLDPPTGYVVNSTDCNDANSAIHPGANEICGNLIDDNCNGQIDENCTGCSVPTGETVTNITSNSAKLKWSEVPGAEGYKVRYKVTGSNSWKKASTSNHSKPISNLLPSTNYTWQVKTYCTIDPNLMSDWCAEQTFTTNPLKTELSNGEPVFEVYPNPFTNSAIITFTVKQDSKVIMELYDVRGKRIQTLLAADIKSGTEQVNFERKNLSAGSYFIKLSVNDDVKMIKVVIE